MSQPILDMNYDEILDNLTYLLQQNQNDFVLNILTDLHPADIADLVERMDSENGNKVFSILPSEVAGEVLSHMEHAPKEDILEEIDSKQIAELVEEMETDDAADVVSDLPPEKASEVLAQVEEETSEEIQELMRYAEDTAGGLMAKEVIVVNAEVTVSQAIEELRRKSEEVEEIYVCYVVDNFDKLIGTVTLKALILADSETLIHTIMDDEVFAIDSSMDQEEVAHIFEKYDLVSAPVVNNHHELLGRITIDDILDVINEETDEDLARIAGIGEEEILEDSVWKIVKARLPWLVISFFGQILSAFIMYRFEATIAQIVATTFFIPLVMAMGGSIGQQSSIIVVRGLATGEINPRDIRRRLLRETKAAFINATVIALLIFLTILLWQSDLSFAGVLAFTLIMVIMNASIFGALIPFGFKKFNIDPAIATGPFVTTFNDVVGLMIYFAFLSAAMYYSLIG